MSSLLKNLVVISSAVWVVGCATVDFDYPKTESFALSDTADTHLGRGVGDEVAAHPGQSGFFPVYDGIESLALRILMIERAERSIDAQYFLIHDDLVGHAFLSALIQAADRGVRVRFLLDDIQAGGYEEGLAALETHENLEIRIFNPFGHRSVKAFNAFSLNRVSRRMHNKSLTVDNQMTLIGGRNIANEYFDANPGEKFGDLDVLAIGPIVPEVSAMFDSYWNHQAAMPMPALVEVPEDAAERLATYVDRVSERREELEASKYAAAVDSSILDFVQTDASAFIFADYQLVFDPPDKAVPDKVGSIATITTQLSGSIMSAEKELFVVTPYFVLAKDNIAGFQELRDRNIEITVLTNSLASNNHAVSHAGYIPSRKPMLEMGTNMYELRASPAMPSDQTKGIQEAKVTLHAKVFAVDRERIFIGSFNWNQRSVNLDTELGVIIHSPEIATEFVELVIAGLPEQSYEVFLNEKNKVRWKGIDDGQEVILTKEPQSGFGRRFNAGFLRIVPNSQL